MDFKDKLGSYTAMVNAELDKLITEKETPEGSIYKAMRYSLMAGGKRLRPVLALAVCELLGGSERCIMPYACALELIHTYSLIHDDLPAMDNDDYRRGRLTCHKVFGEAMAILAGDALLNRAFEIIAEDIEEEADPVILVKKARALSVISGASGASGMIGGQVVDLEAEGRGISQELLKYMHRHKTGALIKASVTASAIICGAGEAELEKLTEYSEMLGLAFQIKDDILDIEGNPDKMGKAKGSDSSSEKSTFVSILGVEASRIKLEEATGAALAILQSFGEKARFLTQLTIFLAKRDR